MEDADLCIRMHMAGPSTAARSSPSTSQDHISGDQAVSAGPSISDAGSTPFTSREHIRADQAESAWSAARPQSIKRRHPTPSHTECSCQVAAGPLGNAASDEQASGSLLATVGPEQGFSSMAGSQDIAHGGAAVTPVSLTEIGRQGASHDCSMSKLSAPAWHRCRGRVVQVNHPPGYTSGRRMAALGNMRTTSIHFILGLGWLLGASPQLLRSACNWLYSDKHR